MSANDMERSRLDQNHEPELAALVGSWLDQVIEPLPARIKDEVVVQAAVIAQHGRWPWQRRRPAHPTGRTFGFAPLAATLSAVAVLLVGLLLVIDPLETPSPVPVPALTLMPDTRLTAEPSPSAESESSPPTQTAEVVVSALGDGDHRTITAALAAASAGDTIRVRPGRYVENLLIDKDVLLVGDGERDQVVIVPISDPGRAWAIRSRARQQLNETFDGGVLLVDTRATLRNLTVSTVPNGQDPPVEPPGPSFIVVDAAPTLEDISFEGYDGAVLLISDGASGSLVDSSIDGLVVIDEGASPVLRGNELRQGLAIYGADSDPLVERNVVRGAASAIAIGDSAEPTIVGNDISTEPSFLGQSTGLSVVEAGADIRDNTIHDSDIGLLIEHAWPEASGNTIRGHDVGLRVSLPASCFSGVAIDNRIEGNAVGVEVLGACPGSSLGDSWATAVHGNAICDNGANVKAPHQSALLDANFVCSQSRDTDDSALRPLLTQPQERRRIQWLDLAQYLIQDPADTDDGKGE